MRFKNSFLNTYMDYVEETESPRIFHIWSCLSGISACLGRRAWFSTGLKPYWPNQFVVLVGPPATQKSTAMNKVRDLIKESTGVKFAPTDTGGRKQGLISALAGTEKVSEELEAGMEAALSAGKLSSLEGENIVNVVANYEHDNRDKHVMYACSDELGSFLGINNTDMLTFLIEMYNGSDYDYELKNSKDTLRTPLLNLIGCTTPTSIAEVMPPGAMGQGFTSRLVFVHCNQKHGSFPRARYKTELEDEIKGIYSTVFNGMHGQMAETAGAASLIDEMHEYQCEISDPRFVHYADRRKTHLIKLAMALAAGRQSMCLDVDDVETAHTILQVTEQSMPDALGEYGLSPLAASKQRLVEFIVAAKEPIPQNVLWAVMHKEMKRVDFISSVADLCNAGKIVMVHTEAGPAYVEKQRTEKKLLALFDEAFPPGMELADA